MSRPSASTTLGLLLVMCASALSPAMAYKWPGANASLGSAIAAKVIAQQCGGALSTFEIIEIDAYLRQSAAELARKPDARKDPANGMPFHESLMLRLTETYTQKYRDPVMCDGDAVEEAQDTLQKVRKAMATGKPIYPDENDPDRKPDVGEAITAKVTADKCRGALSLLEQMQVEAYIAREWVWWAKNAIEADARSAIDGYREAESAIANGWQPKDCDAAAIGKAKKIAARIEKAIEIR